MSEPLVTPTPDHDVEPVDPDRALARKNMALGWLLFGVFVLIFAGTIVVAFVYLSIAD